LSLKLNVIVNRPVTKICFLILLTGIFQHSFSQEETLPLKQSDNKIILEGKIYYVHIVKEGETLYALSKAYNVSEKVIALENPDVFAGLVAGMALKIPAEPGNIDHPAETEEYFYHVVQEGETLYSLAKKYNIELAELEKQNPEVRYGELQINQLLKIPKLQQPVREEELKDNRNDYHLVKQGETLYSLSVLYQVSIDEIKELNPVLKSGPLKFGEYIRIPAKPVTELVTDTIISEPVKETSWTDSLDETFRNKWKEILGDSSFFKPLSGGIHVGLFLPLLLHWDEMQELADTVTEEEAGSPDKETGEKIYHPLTIGFLEFYEGVLLAIDSLKKTGLSITLHTYDTEKNPDVVQELLSGGSVSQLDLIIGPVDPRNVQLVSDFAEKHRIPMISPFASSDELIEKNPFLIQLQSSPRLQLQNYAEYLSGFYDRNIIFIHSGDSSDIQRSQDFRDDILNRISKKTNVEKILFTEYVFIDSLPSDFTNKLTTDTENIIIIPSVREAEVSNILTNIYFLMQKHDIKVFGMYNWPRFRSIDLDYYHKMQLHFFTTFYVDYEKEQVKEFVKKFDNAYSTQPYLITTHGYNLGMLAYDLMLYFCPAAKAYGKNLIFNLNQTGVHPMEGDYLFQQLHPFSGQVNQFTRLITYKTDLTIEQSIPEIPLFVPGSSAGRH